jgi:hypothetical protein
MARSKEIVVRLGIRSIQADRHARNAALLEAVDGRFGEQGRSAGGDIRAQPDLHAVADQIVEIRALQRVAAGENHQGIAEGFDLVEQFETLRGVEFLRMPARLGGCAAVYACQVARLGYFPNHEHRGLVEIHRVSSCNWMQVDAIWKPPCAR